MRKQTLKLAATFAVISIALFGFGCGQKENKPEPAKTMMDVLQVGDALPKTDDECLAFLTHTNGLIASNLQGIYRCRRGMGDSEIDALTYTLERYVGL